MQRLLAAPAPFRLGGPPEGGGRVMGRKREREIEFGRMEAWSMASFGLGCTVTVPNMEVEPERERTTTASCVFNTSLPRPRNSFPSLSPSSAISNHHHHLRHSYSTLPIDTPGSTLPTSSTFPPSNSRRLATLRFKPTHPHPPTSTCSSPPSSSPPLPASPLRSPTPAPPAATPSTPRPSPPSL